MCIHGFMQRYALCMCSLCMSGCLYADMCVCYCILYECYFVFGCDLWCHPALCCWINWLIDWKTNDWFRPKTWPDRGAVAVLWKHESVSRVREHQGQRRQRCCIAIKYRAADDWHFYLESALVIGYIREWTELNVMRRRNITLYNKQVPTTNLAITKTESRSPTAECPHDFVLSRIRFGCNLHFTSNTTSPYPSATRYSSTV